MGVLAERDLTAEAANGIGFKKLSFNDLLRGKIQKVCILLRHTYATHLHKGGTEIRYIQELLGHQSSRTTEIYTHVSNREIKEIRSPIEDMDIKI